MLKEKLLEALRQEYGGTTVYIRARPRIDWAAVALERQSGVSARVIARRLGCCERTVIRNAPIRQKKD